MCCPLERVQGRLTIEEVAFEENDQHEKICYIKGKYDHRPKTLEEKFSRLFQKLELTEKIAEIVDEVFHLIDISYHALHNIHHVAHDIEHTLHSFCFLNDIVRLISGHFFEYDDEQYTQFNYLRSVARVCHAVSHFLATASFLQELKIIPRIQSIKLFKYASAFSAIGYAMWTISLLWHKQKNKHLLSDLGIHLAGFACESLLCIRSFELILNYGSALNKIAALTRMIHASCIIHRLWPSDQESVVANFIIPTDVTFDHHSPHHLLEDTHSHATCFHHVKQVV